MTNEVANTIYQQIGGAKFAAMVGVKNLIGGEKSLNIQFKAKAKNKAKGVVITLDDSDTYTMRFYSISRKLEIIERGTFEGVYCDMLNDIFEDETGLATRL